MPKHDEVVMPVFPGSVVLELDWGRVKPLCLARDGWNDLGAVVLLSKAPVADVEAWYAQQLPEYQIYRDVEGDLLIQADIADFLWDRDYYKYPNIALMQASEQWQASGYATRIELNRPGPQRDALANPSATLEVADDD